LEDAIEEKADGSKERVGQVVRCNVDDALAIAKQQQIIRGNSVVMLEALERMGGGER